MIQSLRVWGRPVFTNPQPFPGVGPITYNKSILKHFVPRIIPPAANENDLNQEYTPSR